MALCEVANIIGGGTPDTSNPLYWNGDIDWFTPTEVGESKYVNESKRKITYAGFKGSSAKLLPRGSILLSTRASVGLASITTNPQEVTTNQGFQSVVPKRVEDSEFLYYVISNQNTQRELKKKANGSTFPEISNSEVSSIIVSLPPDPKERFEISRFLATIDQRIQLQNKIINEVSSLINPLFDAYHKNLEAERFSLCDLAVIKKGEQVNADVMSEENEIPMLNGGTSPSGFFTKSNRGSDTITISEGGNSCGYISFMTVPFWAGGHCYTVHPINRQRIHNRYLYFLLKRQETRIMALRVGSGLPNIQKKDLESFSLSVPSLDQQERIAQKLNIVASKLSLEQNLLDSLRHLKQFLLKNMFI